MEQIDSRRLTGPNLVTVGPGAVIEAAIAESDLKRALSLWQQHVRRFLDAVDWQDEATHSRIYPGGADLVITAPPDQLYAATEVNEKAFEAARAELKGLPIPNFEDAVGRLRDAMFEERNPRLGPLREEAERRGITCLFDDDEVSIGLGKHSHTWPARSLPQAEHVDWNKFANIPTALVTGTNGKSTSVRLLAAMAAAGEQICGLCSTDWIRVGEEIIDDGDYSGPGGARTILRRRELDMAILEVARGGILRRGLGLHRTTAALVTNVAEDHLGEYGVYDLKSLTQTKMVVARAVDPDGYLVLNADDALLVEAGLKHLKTLFWFAQSEENAVVKRHLEAGGDACFVDDGSFTLVFKGERHRLCKVEDAPITCGGAAGFNIMNALGAIATGAALGLKPDALDYALKTFKADPHSNPGRGNLFCLGETKLLVDFAHNPHGVRALMEMAAKIPAKRRLVILGQAGDRDDKAISGLGTAAAPLNPDLVIIKEMTAYLRGREPREIPDLIKAALVAGGVVEDHILYADSEMDSICRALTWAQPGDLLVLLLHSDRDAVLELLKNLQRDKWQPGEPLPAII